MNERAAFALILRLEVALNAAEQTVAQLQARVAELEKLVEQPAQNGRKRKASVG